MKFWDSSAILPLVVEVEESRPCRDALRSDPRVLVWALTSTEVRSGLCRRHHEGGLDSDGLRRAEGRLDRLAGRWTEIEAIVPVREEAERLLHVHRLRAADALQLGAAIVAFDHRPRRRGFVALDVELCAAAEREGFAVLQPRGP